MVNIWNPYQCMVTFNMSRSASFFESGIGRGMGFRDSNQDLLGFVHMVPERARERILDIAATQLPSGGAYHQYQPLTKRGNNEVGSGFNDDPVWLVLGVAAYIKETGDSAILDEPVPFDNAPGTRRRSRAPPALVRLHARRLGPHGLPLIGRADWNDCLNLNCFSDTPGESFQTTENRDGGVAESVFIAGLFVLAATSSRRSPSTAATTRRRTRLPGGRGGDGRRGRRPRLGRRLVPARLRLLRRPGRLGDERRGPDLHRAAGHLRHGGHRARRRARRTGAGLGQGAAGHAARHRAPATRRTPTTTSSSARSRRTRPATRRTPASSATTTRGS